MEKIDREQAANSAVAAVYGAAAMTPKMKSYRIALIPGDGIGREVVPAAVNVLRAAAREFTLDFREFEWDCEYYLSTRRMMPETGLDELRPHDAILLGAIGLGAIGVGTGGARSDGRVSVPDHVSLRDLGANHKFDQLRTTEDPAGFGHEQGQEPELRAGKGHRAAAGLDRQALRQ